MFSSYFPFFKQQFPFVSSIKKKILVGLIIGFFLSFIIIFLEPFDTNEYESNNKTILLSGFGILLFILYLIHSLIENLYYYKANKSWNVSNEIFSIIVFFVISGSIIFIYNTYVINGNDYSFEAHWVYFKKIVIVFIPIFLPLLVLLRYNLGTRILPILPNEVILKGENKNESIKLKKEELLYIKAFQNYIEISFLNDPNKVTKKTFRQTLSNTQQQLPFLEKCHRSYLVNLTKIKNIQGNSQNAKINFLNVKEQIPVSKSLYDQVKNELNVFKN